MLLLALAVIPLALACGPGTGPITDRPTMRFNFSSPLAWTTVPTGVSPAAKLVGGQSLTKPMAQNRIDTDISYAVIKAVESYGYSTAGVVVQNAVAPEEVEIETDFPNGCVNGKFVEEGGAVTKKCSTVPATPDPHSRVGSITVTSPVALAQSQWDNIATKVWASLTSNAGVKFNGLIDVVV